MGSLDKPVYQGAWGI
jgi:hypothetical protein